MTLESVRTIRGFLCSSTAVSAYVSKSDIKVGWPKTLESFPSILLTQAGGMEYGLLGYGAAVAGSRVRREECTIQIDIFGDSRLQTLQIGDAITKVLILSGSCRKTVDSDLFDDEKNVYRKLQTYSYTKYYDD